MADLPVPEQPIDKMNLVSTVLLILDSLSGVLARPTLNSQAELI